MVYDFPDLIFLDWSLELRHKIKHIDPWQDLLACGNLTSVLNLVFNRELPESSQLIYHVNKWIVNSHWKLMKCFDNDDAVLMQELVVRGLDLNSGPFLEEAAHWPAEKLFFYILDQPGIDVNRVHGSRTALHSATPTMCRMLLKRGDLEVNVKDHKGRTPFNSCNRGNMHILMSDVRTDVNSYDNQGRTLLHHLAPSFELEQLLKDERVTLSHRDNDGKSVWDVIYKCQGNCTYEQYMLDFFRIVRHAEQRRLQSAREKIRILQDWSVPDVLPTNQGLDENMLKTHLLPLIADIVTPIEDLDGDEEAHLNKVGEYL